MAEKQKLTNFNVSKSKKIYFAGIGGVGMSALALFCIQKNLNVYGGDVTENSYVKKLREKGAKITIDANLDIPYDVDCCVVSNAIDANNESLKNYVKNGGLLVSRGEFLGWVMNLFKNSIAIAGTHGKTTTTALAYSVFNSCLKGVSLFLGGDYLGENYFGGEGEFCIAEACEYKNSFLSLRPSVSVILNVDYDHVDCFSSRQKVEEAFCDFANNTQAGGFVIAEEKSAQLLSPNNLSAKLITFGNTPHCDYFADNVTQDKGIYSFDLIEKGKKQLRVTTSLAGKHVINSCLAVFALARVFGMTPQQIAIPMSEFKGVDRRWQPFESNFTNVIADYAHHPTEISNLIATAQKLNYQKIYLLFQPHTYSRTKVLLKEFGASFTGVDKLVVLPVYSAREKVLQGGTSQDLVAYCIL